MRIVRTPEKGLQAVKLYSLLTTAPHFLLQCGFYSDSDVAIDKHHLPENMSYKTLPPTSLTRLRPQVSSAAASHLAAGHPLLSASLSLSLWGRYSVDPPPQPTPTPPVSPLNPNSTPPDTHTRAHARTGTDTCRVCQCLSPRLLASATGRHRGRDGHLPSASAQPVWLEAGSRDASRCSFLFARAV